MAAADNTNEVQVLNHLLFHKAIHGEDDNDNAVRLNDYIRIVKERGEGEYVSIAEPFERAIALAFELVLEEHLNPWDIDLVQFAVLYAQRLKDNPEVDLITAGRLLLMAWRICRMQSDELRLKSEPPVEPELEENPWDSISDNEWLAEDTDYAYTMNVLARDTGEDILDEKVRRRGNRRVTLMELMQALEEARAEAELRATLTKSREDEKARRKLVRRDRVEGSAHQEDQDAENIEVWSRITSFNGAPIPLGSLHEGDRHSLVKSLVAVLFLARVGRVRVYQEDFPYGTVYVQNVEAAKAHEGVGGGDADADANAAASSPPSAAAAKAGAEAGAPPAPPSTPTIMPPED